MRSKLSTIAIICAGFIGALVVLGSPAATEKPKAEITTDTPVKN